MDEQERFDQICKPCLERLEKGQVEILNLLKGIDNKPGILDDVRQLKSRWKSIFAAIGLLFAALIMQIANWIVSHFRG